jgi:hypothetical protein
MTSGPDERLPNASEDGRPLDGVLLRDLADRYAASARLSEFDQFKLNAHSRVTKVDAPGLPVDPSAQTSTHAELDTAAETHAMQLQLDKQAKADDPIAQTKGVLASLPARLALDMSTNSSFDESRTVWSASRPVEGWTTASIDGQRRPGFLLVNQSVSPNSTVVHKRVSLDPMPSHFEACQQSLDGCSEGRFDGRLTQLHDGNGPFRTYACIVTGCGGTDFPFSPGDAFNGSFQLKADTPTSLSYVDGDWQGRHDPFVDVAFTNLTRYALQGHKRSFGCDFDQVECKVGYVAMDTDGHAIGGHIIQQGKDSYTRLEFPDGFTADRLVWGFYKNGAVSGRLATVGGLHCPDGTQVQVGGETLNERFCNGDLFEGTIFDQF